MNISIQLNGSNGEVLANGLNLINDAYIGRHAIIGDSNNGGRLKLILDLLTEKKIKFILSNSYTETTKEVFNGYNFIEILTKRTISARTSSRGEVKEFIIKNWKWILISLLSVLICFIGISRIYLGVHYTSDVLGGFLISVSYLVIYISAVNNVFYRNEAK